VLYNTITETLNSIFATTWPSRKGKVFNQIFKATPLRMLLFEGGRVETRNGGTYIEEVIEYDENTSSQWIGRGGSVTLTETDPLTISRWNWRTLTGHIIRYWDDEMKNSGKEAIIRYVNAKIDNLRSSMSADLETALFADGTTSNSIDGLDNIVAEAPGTGTVANINRATYAWWRNNYYDFDSDTIGLHLIKRMNKGWNDCGVYGTELNRFPNVTVTTQSIYEDYEEEAREMGHVVMNAKQNMIDLGFGDMMYKGHPITWSPTCKAESLYLLNTNYLRWVSDSRANMSLGKWLDIVNQPGDVVAHALLKGNLVCSRPRAQKVIFNIN